MRSKTTNISSRSYSADTIGLTSPDKTSKIQKMTHYEIIDAQKAENQLNERFPESIRLLWAHKASILILSTSLIYAQELSMFGEKMIPWYIASAAIYIGGRIADKASTLTILETIDKADSLGIEHGLYETNPDLPAKPTAKQLLGSKRVSKELVAEAAGIIFPPYGFAYGLVSLVAAKLNNDKRIDLEKEINRTLELSN